MRVRYESYRRRTRPVRGRERYTESDMFSAFKREIYYMRSARDEQMSYERRSHRVKKKCATQTERDPKSAEVERSAARGWQS